MDNSSSLIQVHIKIKNCPVPVWRRVVIPTSYSLYDLHTVIQTVMGWTNTHLHGYFIGNVLYVDKLADWEDGVDEGYEDERKVIVESLISKLPKQIMYTYDFGDDWDHEIKFERIVPYKPNVHCPVCVSGKGVCPPEDIGGIWGYERYLYSLKHPKLKLRREFDESYYDVDFDPFSIDIECINNDLINVGKNVSGNTLLNV